MRLFLFLDYDGTLVPIAPTPNEAQPPAELLRLLHRLAGMDSLRVAVISGRSLQNLRRMLPVPGLYLAACHGGLIQPPGSAAYCLSGPVDHARLERLANATLALTMGKQGFLVENKELGLALHYRLAEPMEVTPVLRAFSCLRERYCPAPDWELLSGHKVLEVRPAGINKGAAVLHLLKQYPDAFPVYIGDDVTDEDAFRALAGRGRTILVAETAKPTAAAERMTLEEVRAFLRHLAAREFRGRPT